MKIWINNIHSFYQIYLAKAPKANEIFTKHLEGCEVDPTWGYIHVINVSESFDNPEGLVIVKREKDFNHCLTLKP